jgi:hypothetical protein
LRRCYCRSAEFWVFGGIGGCCWWSELIGSACWFVPSVLVPRWGSACICVYLYVVYKMVWRRIRVFGVRDINLIDYDVILDNQVDERVDWSLRWTNRCVYEGGKRWGWRRWDCRKSLPREANHGLRIPLIAKAVMLPSHSGTEKYDISTCISNLKMCIEILFVLKYIQIYAMIHWQAKHMGTWLYHDSMGSCTILSDVSWDQNLSCLGQSYSSL